jgi:hypothetical protein
MYQLSHLLTDQKSNLSTQLEMSLFGRSGTVYRNYDEDTTNFKLKTII